MAELATGSASMSASASSIALSADAVNANLPELHQVLSKTTEEIVVIMETMQDVFTFEPHIRCQPQKKVFFFPRRNCCNERNEIVVDSTELVTRFPKSIRLPKSASTRARRGFASSKITHTAQVKPPIACATTYRSPAHRKKILCN